MNITHMTNGLWFLKTMTLSRIRTQGGSAVLLSFVIMILLCYSSASLVQVRGSDLSQSTDHIQKTQSSYVALGAVEYAKYNLDRGLDPTTTGKPFGAGDFEVQKDLALGKIYVSSRVGNAKTRQSVDVDFSANCLSFDPLYDVNFGPGGGGIYNLRFKKTCHQKVVVDKMVISWPGALNNQLFSKIVNEDGSLAYNAINAPFIGTPNLGAGSGVEIDLQDVTIADSATHLFREIYMSYTNSSGPVQPETFTVQFIFKDGSSSSMDCHW